MFGDYLKHVLVLILLTGIAYSLPQMRDAMSGAFSFGYVPESAVYVESNTTAVALDSLGTLCPTGYVCFRNNDVNGLYNAYLNASREHGNLNSNDFTITSQKTSETWPRGTRHTITWSASSLSGGIVRAYLVSTTNTVSSSNQSIIAATPVEKGVAEIKLKALDNADIGSYYVKIVLIPRAGGSAIATTSKATIQVVPALPPSMTITAPTAETRWETGSVQRVTWTANFVKGKSKGDTDYSGIKIVPKYGIEPGNRSIDANKFNKEDRNTLMSLSPEDLVGLSQLSPDSLADLDPTKVLSLPGISSSGKNILSKLSPLGFDILQEVDVLGLGDISLNLILKPLEIVDKIDPISHAIFGGLFSDDKPEAVKAIIYIVSSTGQETQLKKTYIEKARSRISLKNVTPGTYKIKLVAQLRNNKTIIALSSSFQVIAKSSVSGAQNTNSTVSPITTPTPLPISPTTPSPTTIPPPSPAPTPGTSITVLTPNGGEIFTRGRDMKITWSSVNIARSANVSIYLVSSTGVETALKTNIPNDGLATPSIPNSLGAGLYKVSIKYVSGTTSVVDMSNASITIN